MDALDKGDQKDTRHNRMGQMGRTGDHTDGQTRHTIGRQWDDGRTEPKSDRDDIRNAQPRQWQQPNDGTWTPKCDGSGDEDRATEKRRRR